MKHPKSFLLCLSGALLVLASCKKDYTTVINNPANKVPVVNAGLSKSITVPIDTVTLSGTASDSDGHVVAYLWSQVSGPAKASIVNPGSPSTLISGMVQGTYVFQLMATDNLGATGVDTATVVVNPNPQKTLILQPNNNATEYAVTILGGSDATGPTIASLEADAWTSGSTWILRGFVKFDLSSIPSTAVIQSANLYLYSNPTPTTGNLVDANYGASNSFVVQQIGASWSTSTINWNNQPAGLTANQVVVPNSTSSVQDLNLDVTAMTAAMINGSANYGYVIKLQNEVIYNSRIFVSSHNATYPDKHPKLVIIYK